MWSMPLVILKRDPDRNRLRKSLHSLVKAGVLPDTGGGSSAKKTRGVDAEALAMILRALLVECNLLPHTITAMMDESEPNVVMEVPQTNIFKRKACGCFFLW